MSERIKLKPRQLADLNEAAARKQTKLNLEWTDDRKTYLIDPPDWAREMLGLVHPVLSVGCPTCHVDPGTWCLLSGMPKENRLHDKRRFKHWQQEHGKSLS